MASSEKQMIPLEEHEDNPEQVSSKEHLVDVVPSRPRRKVVIIVCVVVVLVVVIVAGTLIGIYVLGSKSDEGSKDKGTGESEGSIPSLTARPVETSSLPMETTPTHPVQQSHTSLMPSLNTSSASSATPSGTTNPVPNTVKTPQSSLASVTKPSPIATSSYFQQGQTSSLPGKTSFTMTTNSMSDSPVVPSTSNISLPSSS